MSKVQERTELHKALPVLLPNKYKAGDTFERNTSDGRTWSIEVKRLYTYYNYGAGMLSMSWWRMKSVEADCRSGDQSFMVHCVVAESHLLVSVIPSLNH